MPDDCIFCKIVAGDIPATLVHADEHTVAFADTDPQAPTHLLVVPRRHFRDLPDLATDPEAAGQLLAGVRATAGQEGITQFRTVLNTGAEAGQSVFHVHAHLLAGRRMNWPPG